MEERCIHGGGKSVFQLAELYQINLQPGHLKETLTKVCAVTVNYLNEQVLVLKNAYIYVI